MLAPLGHGGIMRWLAVSLALLLCACSSNDNANNTMNVDENVATVDMNAADMNAVDNATDVNAAAVPPTPPPPPPPPEPTMADGMENEANTSATATNSAETNASAPVKKGVGAFVDPPRMKVKKWYVIEFLVAPKARGPGEMTAGTIEGEAQGKATTAPQTVFLAPQMRVTLTSDPNVQITPKSKDVQAIGLDKAATWQWSVTPQVAGEHELSALVEPLDAQGNQIDSYTRYVKVRADATIDEQIDRATTIGEKLTKFFTSWRGAVLALAALIAALFVLVRTIRNRGKDAPPPGPPSDEEKQEG
jgi:hypothetical protein